MQSRLEGPPCGHFVAENDPAVTASSARSLPLAGRTAWVRVCPSYRSGAVPLLHVVEHLAWTPRLLLLNTAFNMTPRGMHVKQSRPHGRPPSREPRRTLPAPANRI